jgi:hypothetical protein
MNQEPIKQLIREEAKYKNMEIDENLVSHLASIFRWDLLNAF